LVGIKSQTAARGEEKETVLGQIPLHLGKIPQHGETHGGGWGEEIKRDGRVNSTTTGGKEM